MSVTNSIFDGILRELQREENKRKILDPVGRYLENYMKPYFFTLLIVLLVMVSLLLWILKIALSVPTSKMVGNLKNQC
jgi:hypothetical protein